MSTSSLNREFEALQVRFPIFEGEAYVFAASGTIDPGVSFHGAFLCEDAHDLLTVAVDHARRKAKSKYQLGDTPHLYWASGVFSPSRIDSGKGTGRTRDNVQRVLFLVADCDLDKYLVYHHIHPTRATARVWMMGLDDDVLQHYLTGHRDFLRNVATGLGLPPSEVWCSGYGHSLLWALKEDEDGEDVKQARRIAGKLLKALKEAAGYEVSDATSDAGSRGVRLPGSINPKNPDHPRICTVIHHDGPRYSLADLKEILDTGTDEQPLPTRTENPPDLPPWWSEVVPEGQRNDVAYQRARWLVNAYEGNQTPDDAWAELQQWNNACAQPPLEEPELHKVFQSALGRGDDEDHHLPFQVELPPAEPKQLQEVLSAFNKWLYLPDPGIVYAALGCACGNLYPGDPLWGMIIGGPSQGKTEVIIALTGLEFVRSTSTITLSGLLSGVPQKDRKKFATGGLLAELGSFGLLAVKDFTSILSQRTEVRGEVLGALRECFDGHWVRDVGSDGGKKLEWRGKLGMIAGSTSAIDGYSAVNEAMGPRFIYWRLPSSDEVELETEQATRALEMAGQEEAMREELRTVVRGLFASLPDPLPSFARIPEEHQRMIAMTTLTARCRSAVTRDPRDRTITNIGSPESPARLVKELDALRQGMLAIGVPPNLVWGILAKICLDCISDLRRQVLEALEGQSEALKNTQVSERIEVPSTTCERALEELHAHRVVARHFDKNAWWYTLHPWVTERLGVIRQCLQGTPWGGKEDPSSDGNLGSEKSHTTIPHTSNSKGSAVGDGENGKHKQGGVCDSAEPRCEENGEVEGVV